MGRDHRKDPAGRYVSGKRHVSWQKLKFVQTEEFVVGGWTQPRQSRPHFGALLLGYYPEADPSADHLIFAGQVGSGFSQAGARPCRGAVGAADHHRVSVHRLSANRQGRLLGSAEARRPNEVHRVDDGRLAPEPGLSGLRTDTRPDAIRLPDRRPSSREGLTRPPSRSTRRSAGGSATTRPISSQTAVVEHPEPRRDELLETLEDLERRQRRGTLVLSDGARVPAGNLHKVFWPDPQITKGELLRFYLRVASYILPVVADRPLVMKRFPNGVEGKSFYQHRAPDPLPEGLRVTSVRERRENADSGVPYLIGGTLQSLLYMAQLAVISQDPWFSHLPDIGDADMVALDLDPMPSASFTQVLDVACWLHDELTKLGTPCFPKTSGSEGVHIFIPLAPGTHYEAGMNLLSDPRHRCCAAASEGGNGGADGEEASRENDLHRLLAEHLRQDARVGLQRARERIRRRLDSADMDRSPRRRQEWPDARRLHDPIDSAPVGTGR